MLLVAVNKIVASLLLDTKGYKSTVTKINSNYVAEICGLLPATCCSSAHHVAGQYVALA